MASNLLTTLLCILSAVASSTATGIMLQSNGLERIGILYTDSTVLKALSGWNIAVTVCLPNEVLKSAASDQGFTDDWVKSNILPYHSVEAVAVGNEVFTDPNNVTEYLLPAMKNVYSSLLKSKIKVNVSSPIALTALVSSYHPSFNPDLVEPVLKPMLSFLRETGSYLMVNVSPFFAYGANSDPNSGMVYRSLFQAQIDAAMTALQFDDLKLVKVYNVPLSNAEVAVAPPPSGGDVSRITDEVLLVKFDFTLLLLGGFSSMLRINGFVGIRR